MSLKQLNNIDRILFLQKFIKEMIINSGKELGLKLILDTEKIKRKYLDEDYSDLEKVGVVFNKEYKKSMLQTEERKEDNKKKIILPKRIPHHSTIPFNFSQSDKRLHIKPNLKILKKSQKLSQSSKTKNISQFSPGDFQSSVFGFEKIKPFIKDLAVQMIECPGPGKNIIVKVRNKLNMTKVILSNEDIKSIIDYFSKKAKIPVIGGILKAAVDNLIISAITSEFVGSRFIITKKSPYSLIEGVRPRRY